MLLPLIGLPGFKLSYLRIVGIIRRLPESQVRRVLAAIEDISKLEHLHISNEEPDVFPAKFIERAPLKDLQLWPKQNPYECKPQQYTKLGLRTEILEKSTLEELALGLNRDWYTPEIKALGDKYLPGLKYLWLDLCTFSPEMCVNPSCANTSEDSLTCFPFPSAPFFNTTDEMRRLPRNIGACSRQPPALFLKRTGQPRTREFKDPVSKGNKRQHVSRRHVRSSYVLPAAKPDGIGIVNQKMDVPPVFNTPSRPDYSGSIETGPQDAAASASIADPQIQRCAQLLVHSGHAILPRRCRSASGFGVAASWTSPMVRDETGHSGRGRADASLQYSILLQFASEA